MDSTSVEIPNSRALVKQILTLSQDVDNQPFIVQEEGCLAGLCSYINHQDVDVVLMAARSLQFLSSHPLAKDKIISFPGLISALKKVNTCETSHPKAIEFTSSTLINLGVENKNKDDDVADSENNPNYANSKVDIVDVTPNKKSLRGYPDDNITEASSPFDEANMPRYLDEDDYEDDSDDEDCNLKVTKFGCSSLEARLEESRLEEERKQRDVRMIGKVGSLFQNASSWLMGY